MPSVRSRGLPDSSGQQVSRSIWRGRGDSGSIQILMPVGVLVVLVLGAIAFDLSWVYQAQRELTDAAASAANDAVTYGLSPASMRDGSGGRLDAARVQEAVDRSLSIHALTGVDHTRTTVDITSDEVRVTLVRHVDYVFAKGMPAANRGRDVTASVAATVIRR